MASRAAWQLAIGEEVQHYNGEGACSFEFLSSSTLGQVETILVEVVSGTNHWCIFWVYA